MKNLSTNACHVAITTKYFEGNVILTPERYHNGQTAIIAYMDNGERAFVATVNMPLPPKGNCVWLKGWSENEGMPAELVRLKLVEFTGRTAKTGYTFAQEAKLLDITGREVTLTPADDASETSEPEPPASTTDPNEGERTSGISQGPAAAGKTKKKAK